MEPISVDRPCDPSKRDAKTFALCKANTSVERKDCKPFVRLCQGSDYVIPIGRHVLLLIHYKNPNGIENMDHAKFQQSLLPKLSKNGLTKQST
jgi:hypothetical protein